MIVHLNRTAASLLICGLAVLATTAAEAATRTWKTVPADAFWSNPANWQEGVAPVNGDDLVFPEPPNSPATVTMTNTIANLQVRSIRFAGRGYAIGGQPLSLGEGGIRGEQGANNGGAWSFNLSVSLHADQGWNSGSNVEVTFEQGLALNGHEVTIGGAPGYVRCVGVVSGSGTWIVNGSSCSSAKRFSTSPARCFR